MNNHTERSGGPMAATVDKMQQSKNCLANCDCINCRDISGGPMAATVDKIEEQQRNELGLKLWLMAYRGEFDTAIRRACESAGNDIMAQFNRSGEPPFYISRDIERHVRRELGL